MSHSPSSLLIQDLSQFIAKLQDQVRQLQQPSEEQQEPAVITGSQATHHELIETLEIALEELENSLEELLQQQDRVLLAEAQSRAYRDIFRLSPEAQLVTTPTGIIRELNPATERLLQCPQVYLRGQPLANYFDFHNRRQFRAQLRQLQLGQQVARWEDRICLSRASAALGNTLPVEVLVIPIKVAEETQLHWLLRDISTQQQAAIVLQDANKILEQRVQERTQTLSELNAQLSQEIAERLWVERTLEQKIQRERLLKSVAQKIRESLNLDDILETAVSEVRHFLKADRVVVYRFKDNLSGVVTAESVSESFPTILHTVIEDPCFRRGCAERYQQGAVRAVSNVRTEITSPCLLQLLRNLQVQASLTVPILQGKGLWGLLNIQQCTAPRQWEPSDIEMMQDLTTQLAIAIQQSELYERVQQLAVTDALTQVANRYRFESYLEETWQRLSRDGSPLAFILCDIDFFKDYNECYGHPAGDLCLRRVADILSSQAKRPTDLVARYGGEEFAIVLPDTDLAGAQIVLETIRQAIAAAAIDHAAAPNGRLTLSYGIVGVVPSGRISISTLIQAADNQLYRAKTSGRDQWQAIALDSSASLVNDIS